MAVMYFLLSTCGVLALAVAGMIGFVIGRSWSRLEAADERRNALPHGSPRLGEWCDIKVGYYVHRNSRWVQIADISEKTHDLDPFDIYRSARAYIDTDGDVFEVLDTERAVYRLPEHVGTGDLTLSKPR